MDRMKHGLRALGVLLVVVLAGCTDATPTPTAADIPDEPEAPPNTTTPLGDPINPDPPQPPPPPPPPPPNYTSSIWILRVSGNDSCDHPLFLVFAEFPMRTPSEHASIGGVANNSRTSLVWRGAGDTYEFILLTEFPPEVRSGTIESYTLVSPDFPNSSCSGTGGTFSRTPR